MAIYTKTGDKGTTGIHGGTRVPKDDIRIECNGCIDELNSLIGVLRANIPKSHTWQRFLFRIQKEMMAIMSLVATPNEKRQENPNRFDSSLIADCERFIDEMTKEIGVSKYFLLPGGNIVSAHLQMARTYARRAERRLWSLNRQDEVPKDILIFFNRLSDLFFVMARYELFANEEDAEVWKAFAYKKKK